MRNRSTLKMIVVIVAALIPFNVIAQQAETCQANAEKAARRTLARIAADQKIAIPSITSDAVITDIATEICKVIEPAQAGKVSEFASTVSALYFESAIRLGKATEVAALVEGAVGGAFGLGLTDFRRYGVLTVSCRSKSAAVEVRGSVTRCGSRVLLNMGEFKITVRDAAAPICEVVAMLAERQELTCDCVAGARRLSGPLSMACR
jgi:hypothetical protein